MNASWLLNVENRTVVFSVEMSHTRPSSRTRLFRLSRQVVWGCFGFTVVNCLVVLTGVILDMPLMRSWVPEWPMMKAATAVAMLMTVTALLAASASRWPEMSRWRQVLERTAEVLSLGILLFGGLVLLTRAHLLDWPAPPDSFWELPTPAAGMSVSLHGLALLTARHPRVLRVYGMCTVLALSVAWLALVNLLYGADTQVPNILFGNVSLPSAIGMLVLCSGLAMLRPQAGVIRVLAENSPTGALLRRLLPLAVGLTFGFGLLRLRAQQLFGFTTEFGAAFYATVATGTLVAVILHHARTTSRMERRRTMLESRIMKNLAERERLFRGIFNSTFQFIGLTTRDGVILEVNQSSLDATGSKADEVVGKKLWQCPWWAYSQDIQERIRIGVQQAATGGAVRFETEYMGIGGDVRLVDFSLNPVLGAEGQVAYIVPEGRDITDDRLLSQKLESTSQRLKLATQTAELGIWDWNIETHELVWDEMMHHIYRVPSEGTLVSYDLWARHVHEEDLTRIRAAQETALADGGEYSELFRIRWPDGSVRHIQSRAVVQRDTTGKPVRMLGTHADITKQVLRKAALLESEERFRHAFEYSAIGFALLAPDGTWLKVNRALCSIVGYTEEELLGRTFQDITHPDDLELDLEHVKRLKAGEVTHFQMEKRYLQKDGGVVWVMLTASLVRETDGTPAYFISQVEDITQRHEAERVLNYQQKQLRMLIEHTPAAVAMFDMDMRYVAASRRWKEDYNLQDQTLLGRSHYDVFPEIEADWKAIHQRALAGSVENRDEDMFVRTDGQQEWLRWEVRPWMEVDGQIGGVVMFTEVITERKQAAEKIRASLEEKEVLLREIHHRVKNNMQIISSLLQLQISALHDPADEAIFKDCQARIHAMSMVHDRLYRSGNLSTINFGEHLRELAQLTVRGQADRMGHIRLETECEDVDLDLDKAIPLGLIATELITNAFKHAFNGREEGRIIIQLKVCEGKRMRLLVSDDGVGLSAEISPGNARTLGLRLVRSLSRQMRAQTLFHPVDTGCCVEVAFDV